MAWRQPCLLDYDVEVVFDNPSSPPPPTGPSPSHTPPPGDSIPPIVLADLFRREDIVGSPVAALSPPAALDGMGSVALVDSDPPVDPPAMEVAASGVVAVGAPCPPAPVVPADTHGLPAPSSGGGCPDVPSPAPLSVRIVPADEVPPAGRVPPLSIPAAAASPCAADFPEFGIGIPAWLANVEHASLPSGSSDHGTLFATGVTPAAYGPTPLTVKPILFSRNLLTIARNAFSRGQAEQLIPALLNGFATDLSFWDIHERLRLLWLMRRDVTTLVQAMIIVGQARCKLPGEILRDMLEMARQYASYTD